MYAAYKQLSIGLLAQSVEQLAFNQLVTSSNLVQPTNYPSTRLLSMKIFIHILITTITFTTYAVDSSGLLNVQNNYQAAKSDLDAKQEAVERQTRDLTAAKNDLQQAQTDLQRAQTNLKDAQSNLGHKKTDLSLAKKNLDVSKQNLNNAVNAVNKVWQDKLHGRANSQ